MASIGYLLMTEFHSEASTAGDNYGRKFAFDSAEGMVNNFLHGHTTQECLSLTKQVITEWTTDESHSTEEQEAYKDALIIINLFAEQYNLELN
jgi:hypothetical protein